ncbi:hypothetical protein ACOSQ3_003186 [Xanthoceras sorbifolium]
MILRSTALFLKLVIGAMSNRLNLCDSVPREPNVGLGEVGSVASNIGSVSNVLVGVNESFGSVSNVDDEGE